MGAILNNVFVLTIHKLLCIRKGFLQSGQQHLMDKEYGL